MTYCEVVMRIPGENYHFGGLFSCLETFNTVIQFVSILRTNFILFTLFFRLKTEQVGVDPCTYSSMSLKSVETHTDVHRRFRGTYN